MVVVESVCPLEQGHFASKGRYLGLTTIDLLLHCIKDVVILLIIKGRHNHKITDLSDEDLQFP